MATAWKGCFALTEKRVVSNAMSFMSIIIDTILLQELITSHIMLQRAVSHSQVTTKGPMSPLPSDI